MALMAHPPNRDERSSRTSYISHRCFALPCVGVAPDASVSDEEPTIFLGSLSCSLSIMNFSRQHGLFSAAVFGCMAPWGYPPRPTLIRLDYARTVKP